MKKTFSVLLIFVLLITLVIPSTGMQSTPSIKVKLDGKQIYFDSQPFMENGRTMVPFRAVFEALGADVGWDEPNKTVTGTKDGIKIALVMNKSAALVNDKKVKLDVPAKIRDGRIFVPTRFVAENFGVRVYWDSLASTVVLLSDAVDPAEDQKYLDRANLPSDTMKRFTFWHYNTNVAQNIENDFEKRFPNIDMDAVVIPYRDSRYVNQLAATVRSGAGVPDVVTLESEFAKRFINMKDCFMDITDKVGDITENMYPYTVDYGKDDSGKIRALSNQINSGAIGYKRQVAKKYLGTDDPNEISEMLSSQDKILSMAETLKQKSNGKVALFPSWEELEKIYLGGRSTGWVVDKKLNIDQKVLEYIDLAKTMRNKKYEQGFGAWTPTWTSSIGADEQAMCWAIPSWGVSWIIGSKDSNAKDGGRWGLAKPILPYFWEGTWYGVSQISQKKDIALEFLRFFTSDENQLKQWSIKSGDMPNSRKLMREMGSDTSYVNKITGQNLYEVFGGLAEGVNGKISTMNDYNIDSEFNDCMRSYLAGNITSKDKLIATFKQKVKANIKEINVD